MQSQETHMSQRSSFMSRSLASLALTAVAAAAATTMATSAVAATVGPADDTFFTLPSSVPAGSAGTLVSYRETTVNLGDNVPAPKAWNVLYKSTDSVGQSNVVSGTVLVPNTSWPWWKGSRPVVLYAVGTHGLATECAPSRQMAKGTDYENANIAAALKEGYAVLVSDYVGYTNGQTPRVDDVKAINILVRDDGLSDTVFVDMFRERRLHQHAIDRKHPRVW